MEAAAALLLLLLHVWSTETPVLKFEDAHSHLHAPVANTRNGINT